MKNLLYRFRLVLGVCTMMVLAIACTEEDAPILPTAGFEFEATLLTVEFTNSSANAIAFAWDFGDENTSTEVSPIHTYAAYGDYEVTLTVTSEDDETHTFSTMVTLTDPCAAWDGTSSGNLIQGGGFELCDAKYWNVLYSGQKDENGEFAHAKYEFGYEDYNPANGEDGALYIHPDNDASGFEEGTILYQQIDLTEGAYQISGLVKAGGEDKDNPTSKMNSYWFEVVINEATPTEGDGYNHTRTTGWFYGGWTGWAVELPALDGEIPHGHMDGNLANEQGMFNINTAGTYYLVIKFGKGNDADGASFGDGIALDNLSLQRTGDIDECLNHDGTEPNNYIVGGGFETCDEQYWTILATDIPAAPYAFGYTDYAPANGSGGAFYVSEPTENMGSTMYQHIGQLEAGDYQLNAEVKLGGVESGMANYWYEMLVWTEEPVEGAGYSPEGVARIAGYIENTWGGGVDAAAYDGELQYNYTNGNTCDADGVFSITADGDYYFVLKWGFWGGSLGEGIALDNLSLTKVQ